MNMNNKTKLEMLSKEFSATMNHAVEVMNEIVATTIEQTVLDAIDEINDFENMLLLFDMLDEMEQEAKKDEEDIVKAFAKARQDLQPKPQPKQENKDEEEIVKAFMQALQDLNSKM